MKDEKRDTPGALDRISVVVPTLNEAGNVDPLIEALLAAARSASLDMEIIIVDDGSTDGTRERVRAWAETRPVKLIAREGERGLAGAVLRGAASATSEVVVVMDADLSHPIEKVPELARPILAGTSDMVIGSRRVAGGENPGWPLSRRLISRAAAALAWPFADARDPLSGFFAVRRERLLLARETAGFKIGLEVLARSGGDLRVEEVPISFRDRTLSKYSMALLGLAALSFLVLDRRSRRWLARPEPYGAMVLATLIFLPVILWNMDHGWASFVFQGTRRWSHSPRFNFHELIGSALLLITPLGVLGFILGMRGGGNRWEGRRLFPLLFTLVPLSVFVISSFRNETKLSWTGPVWLAALPVIAAAMAGDVPWRKGRMVLLGAWKPVLTTLVLFYGAGLHLQVLGLPGIRVPRNYYSMSWEDLGRQVEDIELEVIGRTGEEPLIVGMDKYHISSEVAFYDPNQDGATETAGWHLFGRNSLMYEYWFPRGLQEGKSLVLVSNDLEDLTSRQVEAHVKSLEPVRELLVRRRGKVVGRYYSRVAHGYRSNPESRAENR